MWCVIISQTLKEDKRDKDSIENMHVQELLNLWRFQVKNIPKLSVFKYTKV